MTIEHEWVDLTARGIQVLAVLIMLVLILIETVRWVAADIIETAAVDLTLRSLSTLGILVVVRTALSWTITVEVEGRWPWQRDRVQDSR